MHMNLGQLTVKTAEFQHTNECKFYFILKNRSTRVTWFIIYWHPARAGLVTVWAANYQQAEDIVTLTCNAILHCPIWAFNGHNIISEPDKQSSEQLQGCISLKTWCPTICIYVSHMLLMKSAKTREYRIESFCSVGGQSTEEAYVSWLIVTRGFSGHHVFHNDMERSLDMRTRGHPALSLLIPDSSFSLDSTRFNYQTRLWVLLDKGESQGTWTRTHKLTHTQNHSQWKDTFFYFFFLNDTLEYNSAVVGLICCLNQFNNFWV